MRNPASRQRAISLVILCIGGAGLLLPAPCPANVAPESGLFAHVQPVSGSCETSITDCAQIIRSTSAEGPVEFLLFFMRGIYSWEGEALCLQSLHTKLSWPEAWQLLEFQPCAGGWGSLDPAGPTHALDLEWWYGLEVPEERNSVMPVARLVMNVVGPGRLDLVGGYGHNPVELRHDCYGSSFVTYPVEVYAEAGIACGHISTHCGYHESSCEPEFSVSELLLTAPSGASADSTIEVSAWQYGHFCGLTIDPHAPWCTAEVGEPKWYGAPLHVTADAAALPPGTYETAIELSAGSVARCLRVVFTVEQNPTATSMFSWGRVKTLHRQEGNRSAR